MNGRLAKIVCAIDSPWGRAILRACHAHCRRDEHLLIETAVGIGNLILSHVPFVKRVSDSARRTRLRVQITETATTAGYVRHTFRYRAILAVPVNAPSHERYDCTPGSVAIGTARRSPEHCRRRDTDRQSCNCFRHDRFSLVCAKVRLQQGFAGGEMGLRAQVAQQQS